MSVVRTKLFRLALVLVVSAMGGGSVGAQSAPVARQAPVKVLVNVDAHGVALAGHDPVSFFTDSAAVRGDSTIVASYQGATYRFASAAHRALFLATPAKYVPQFGGFCAYGASRGYPAPVEIDTWQIIAGRLTLNYNRAVRATFDQDIPGYLAKANANWPGIVAEKGTVLTAAP